VKEIKKINAIEIKQGISHDIEVLVPREFPFTIYLNGEKLVALLATPRELKELAVGYLYSEGILKELADLEEVLVNEEKRTILLTTTKNIHLEKIIDRRFITSGSGKGASFFNISEVENIEKSNSKKTISSRDVSLLMETMYEESELHKKAGGVHTSAISDGKKIIAVSEDIGRNNTIDKVLGHCFLKGVKTDDKILLSTGRTSSEMLLKAASAGIPIVVSRTAATDLAIQAARELKMTLVSYTRANTMRIYANERRIT